MAVEPIRWKKDHLQLLDQTRIPREEKYLEIRNLQDSIDAIKNMIVRGAPAIAITGMFGATLYFISCKSKPTFAEFLQMLELLLQSRPTAVNLKLAIDSLASTLPEKVYQTYSLGDLAIHTEKFAVALFEQDVQQNRSLAKNALELFQGKKLGILTHCNTGSLATAGHGTALGIIRSLKETGHDVTVYADETRPYLQGSRLTAWEMQQEGIDCFIITDSMAGWLMSEGKIDAVITGVDRIASNGDAANKIGTYSLSVLAKEHSIPFYIAGTVNSFDMKIKSGKEIVIEMRDEAELLNFSFLKDATGKDLFAPGLFSPIGSRALNPAFDVTPAKNITAIITEKGIIRNPNSESVRKIMGI